MVDVNVFLLDVQIGDSKKLAIFVLVTKADTDMCEFAHGVSCFAQDGVCEDSLHDSAILFYCVYYVYF